MTEQEVIEQLSSYKQLTARARLLENYSVGAGVTVSRLSQDDQLQDLHRQLRGLPTYMYLSGHEQRLESVAHAYASHYPSGVRAQREAIPASCMDPEDARLLRELRTKIQKVIDARTGQRSDIDDVLTRLAEYQDLQAEITRIDSVLEALASYKSDYARLLRIYYVEGNENAAKDLSTSQAVFFRMRKKAVAEYAYLAR